MKLRQLFIDAYECDGQLNSARALLDALLRSAESVGAKPMQGCHTEFQPHGVTSVLILAESHFVVSTWPEFKYAAFDALLCNDAMDPMVAWRVVEKVLHPTRIEHHWIIREITTPNG